MNLLEPNQCAEIASKVYEIREQSVEDALKTDSLGIDGMFHISNKSRFEGTSGPLFLKTKTGFGYIAEGVGERSGEVLIATRGTVPGIQDIATDLNAGLQRSPSGEWVHGGFNDTFNSFRTSLDDYFLRKNPSHVHCVGHSLGGALATLVADYVTTDEKAGVSLYSFGCPRVGLSGFACGLTKKINPENIKRVYFDADIVPKVPIYPFYHIPKDGLGIGLKFKGGVIAPQSHFMVNYIDGVGDQSWSTLERNTIDKKFNVEEWLKTTWAEGGHLYSTKLQWMISKALAFILGKIIKMGIGVAITASMTVLDRIAWALHQGWLLSKKIAGYVVALIRKIYQFLGKVYDKSTKVTASFLRWILDSLTTVAMNIAYRALMGTAAQIQSYEAMRNKQFTPKTYLKNSLTKSGQLNRMHTRQIVGPTQERKNNRRPAGL